MNRRFAFAGLASMLPSIFAFTRADAASQQACVKTNNRDSVSWKVPKGIRRIRVRSWNAEGDELIDTHFSVEDGQEFRINVVRD